MTIDEKIQQALNAPDDCGYARLAKDLARFLQESRAPAAVVTSADGGWIPWTGGARPLPGGTLIKVRFRGGADTVSWSEQVQWDHTQGKWRETDIVAYKVVT